MNRPTDRYLRFPRVCLRRISGTGDNNGDVVFLDLTHEYSVWLWYYNGNDAERLAESFEQWIEIATLCEDEDIEDDDD